MNIEQNCVIKIRDFLSEIGVLGEMKDEKVSFEDSYRCLNSLMEYFENNQFDSSFKFLGQGGSAIVFGYENLSVRISAYPDDHTVKEILYKYNTSIFPKIYDEGMIETDFGKLYYQIRDNTKDLKKTYIYEDVKKHNLNKVFFDIFNHIDILNEDVFIEKLRTRQKSCEGIVLKNKVFNAFELQAAKKVKILFESLDKENDYVLEILDLIVEFYDSFGFLPVDFDMENLGSLNDKIVFRDYFDCMMDRKTDEKLSKDELESRIQNHISKKENVIGNFLI